MKVLMTGAGGQLGRCLLDRLPKDWDIYAPDHSELDITSPKSLAQAFEKFQPDVVVNTAAYTAVDKAEEDFEAAKLVNASGPKYIAENCAKSGALLIHLSSDYIFSGRSREAYIETDTPAPLGAYGRSKLAGEEFVEKSGADYIILRTAWLFSQYGHNFLKTMLDLGNSRDEIAVVADQFGGPTYGGDLADAIISIIKETSVGKIQSGIYHYGGTPKVSWADFAREIFKQDSQAVVVTDIATEDYPAQAARPAYSLLDTAKIKQAFGIESCDWKKGVTTVLEELRTDVADKKEAAEPPL